MKYCHNKLFLHIFLCLIVLSFFSNLVGAASISGNIMDSDGKPIVSHYVSVYSWDGKILSNYNDFATDENGNYYIDDIKEGIYFLEFTDWGGPYLEQAYATDMPLDIDCINYHTPLTIEANTNLKGINSTLSLGATLSGRITGPDGEGIPNVYVYVDSWSGSSFVQQSSIPLTDQDGYYTAVGLAPGTYYLHAEKPDGPYLSQGYRDEIPFKWGTLEGKKPITIRAGENLTDINMQLSLAGSISGRVTDVNGKGISDVYTYAYSWDGKAFSEQASIPLSDENGYYTIPGLVSGDYYLHFVPRSGSTYVSLGYLDETPFTWGNIDYKTAIRIEEGQNFADINVQLMRAASISGRVTDTNGDGISGVYAYAYTWDGNAFIEQISIPLSDENGYYTIPGLVSGDYYLHFVKPDSIYSSLGYPNEVPFKWGEIEGKSGIRMSTGQQITELNVQLVTGGNSSLPPSTVSPNVTPVPTSTPLATVNDIVGYLFTVTPENVQLNTSGDRPKVNNVLVMLTEENSGVSFERESKTEIILQEKTVAVFHPPTDEQSTANEPVTLIRGTIESIVDCNDYELRTSVANIASVNSCSCYSNSTLNRRSAKTHTQFTASYSQNGLDGSLIVSVNSGVVEISDRNNNTTTVTAGEVKTIKNMVRRTTWVLPIDGDKVYGGKNNKFVWTAYPNAVSYKLEYNLPLPEFAEENAAQEEFSTFVEVTDFSTYEDLVIFDIPIPKGLNGKTVEARIFAVDSNGKIISESVSSDKFSVTFSDD